jgi:hypothetical protein
VEQAAAAAESLVEQAASLIETVSAYKLGASDSHQSSREIADVNVISESVENNVVWEMF